uniref:cysteine dioxygenase n=1 Tax=Oryza sativa subsp. japonica TaxID=39947 RepID=Q6Z3M5_ORYSJ|nr:HGWP repeat containing protein-like protein [Oryza sativa Japonica Group]BAD05571.1 HGWP repeat containing protein-like protein [Oryza sativa Japonica Group]
MPPLLGVYDFTAGLPPSPPTGVFAYTVGWSHHRCWASTTSPPACLRRHRLVPPPTRLAYYATVVGRLRLHRRPASVAADWCLRLHGWPIMPPLLGVYVFTTGLPPSSPIGASAYTAGLLCRRCWASTTSPPACLRRRRLVPPPTRLAYYATVVGRLRLHHRPASVAADWCLRLHGWSIMPPLLGVYDFTAGLPLSPPTGVLAYTVGWSHHRSWASTSSPPACLCRRRLVPPPARLAFMPPLLGVYVFTDRLAFAAADWCFRLHGWPLCRRCWASTSSPTGRPSPPPTGVSACTAGLYAAVVGRLRLHRPACLRRRRLVFPPTWLAYYAAAVGRLRLHRRPASVAADWCFRLHGWPNMPPLLGVYDFTASLPPSPPIGASAYTAGLLCRRCWASTTSPPACLRRRRLVPPPTRLAFMPPLLGVYVFTDRLAFAAADWCFRLHGWPIMPPLLGVYDFTAGLPPSPPIGASAYTAGLICRRCWASMTSPPACLRRRRLVPPPTRLAYYAAAVWRLRLHRRPASVAADWCLRLHGWPIMPPLLGVYDFTAGLPPSPPTGASAYTAGLLCRRCWASTTSPPACLRRRRLVPPPTRLAYYAAAVGCLRLHRWPASAATDWIQIQICIKGIHGFKLISYAPGMDQSEHHHRLASAAADWCFRLHGWPIMPPLLGAYVFTDRLAFVAADWCPRLHGWLIMPPLLGAYVFTDRLAFAAADCWPIMPPLLGAYVFTDRLAFVAAGWCPCLHGWPIMPPLLGAYVFTNRLAFVAADWCPRLHGWPIMPPLLGAYVFTDRLAFAAADWCPRLHGWPIMPPLLGAYVFTDRLAFAAADWCPRLHGWLIMPPLLGAYVFTDRLAFAAADWCFRLHGWPLCRRCWASTSSPTGSPSPPPTGVHACTAGLLCRRCWAPTSSPTGSPSSPPTGVLACTAGLLCRRCWAPTSSPTGLPSPPPTGVLACTAGLLCRRCWAPTSSPTGLPSPPPTGVSACTAGLLCRRCWASTSSPTGLPSPPPTGVSACTAGLLCRRCWASTSSPTGRFDRRRLVFPPARLAYYAAVVGRLRLHRPATASAADWCHRLHGWPVITPTDAIFFTAGYIAVTTNRHQYLQHKLPTFAMAADWFLHFHGCYIAIDWITDIVIFINILSSLINIAYSAAVDGKLRHHSRLSLLPLIIITVGCVCRRRLFSSSS